jgi:hypothetical protein
METEMHRKIAENAKSYLLNDQRFIAMAIGGSWINRQLDEFSDLDVYLLYDNHISLSLNEKKEILDSWGSQLCFYTNGHDADVTVSIYDFSPGLLHVDCRWTTLDRLKERVEDPEIIFDKKGLLSDFFKKHPNKGYRQPDLALNESRFWSWMHYVLSKIGRGEILEAYDYLCEVRSCCIGPMVLMKHGMRPYRMRMAEKLPPNVLSAVLKTFPERCDALSCLNATVSLIELYTQTRDSIKKSDLIVNTAAENACKTYANYIQNKITYGK